MYEDKYKEQRAQLEKEVKELNEKYAEMLTAGAYVVVIKQLTAGLSIGSF